MKENVKKAERVESMMMEGVMEGAETLSYKTLSYKTLTTLTTVRYLTNVIILLI